MLNKFCKKPLDKGCKKCYIVSNFTWIEARLPRVTGITGGFARRERGRRRRDREKPSGIPGPWEKISRTVTFFVERYRDSGFFPVLSRRLREGGVSFLL